MANLSDGVGQVVIVKRTPKITSEPLSVYLCLLAYATAVFPYLMQGSPAVVLLCFVIALWRWHLTVSNGIPPSINMTALIGVAGIIILLAINGFTISPQFGITALMVLVGAKNLASRTPSEFSNNLMLLPFIPMGFFLISDPVWGNGYLLLFIWIWISALVRVWHSNLSTTQSIYKGLQILLTMIPIILIAYFLLPRPQPWNGKEERQASTGMSSTLRPGDVGKLSQNEATAFVASFPRKGIDPEQAYWRGMTFSNYQHGEWSTGLVVRGASNTSNAIIINETLPYTISFPEKTDSYLYSLDHSVIPSAAMGHDGSAMIPQGKTRKMFASYDGIYYPKQTLKTPPLGEEYQRLENDNPQATAWAQELSRVHKKPKELIDALRQEIQKQGFSYSLEPGAMRSDWIDTFLFDRKQGFCEHYAGSVTYILRQAGIPSRVVVGFQGSRPGASSKKMEVPFSAAHAWLEYWDNEQGQWVTLDPTSWVAPERLTAQYWNQTGDYKKSAWLRELSFLTSQVELQWGTWVTYYDAEQQKMLWGKIKTSHWEIILISLVILLLSIQSIRTKKWYALSPSILHQWKYLLQYYNLGPEHTVVTFKQQIKDRTSRLNTWLYRLELILYADERLKLVDYVTWLLILSSIKSTTYKKFIKKLSFSSNPA